MFKIVLYGAGEIGKKNYDFLKKYNMETFVMAFCDRNHESVNEIFGTPVKSYESFDDSAIFVVSMNRGRDEVEAMLKADKRKYYDCLEAWIFDSFDGEERNKLYFEYTNANQRWKKPDVIKIEGARCARKWMNELCKAESCVSKEIIKIGTQYGAWAIPKDFVCAEDEYILCVGAGEDISFDCGMAEKFMCNVITVDPTPRAINHYKRLKKAVEEDEIFYVNNTNIPYEISKKAMRKVQYMPIGLAHEDKKQKFYFPQNEEHVSCSIVNLQDTEEYFEADCYTYKTLLQKLQVEKFKLIKIDIEGMEYDVINSIIESGNLPDVLCVDFDETNIALDMNAEDRICNIFSLLEHNGMRPIWIEGDSATFLKVC